MKTRIMHTDRGTFTDVYPFPDKEAASGAYHITVLYGPQMHDPTRRIFVGSTFVSPEEARQLIDALNAAIEIDSQNPASEAVLTD
jgi:hypothetical protein